MAHYAITGTTWGAGGTTWAATSGGSATLGDPTNADDVIFDGNSPNVTCSGSPVGKTLTTTGYNGTISGALLVISGDITLSATTTITNSSVRFGASGTLTANGATLTTAIVANTNGTTVQLGGALVISGNLVVSSTATFTTNNHNITCASFQMTAAGTWNLGSSVITITGAAATSLNVTAGTINAGTSVIKFTDTSNTGLSFVGGGKTFYDVWFDRGASTGTITITGANTFNELKHTGTAAMIITFPNVTTTVSIFSVRGVSPGYVQLSRTGASGTWTLSVASGIVSIDWVVLSNSTATGGATFYAGANSINNGGNTGWFFTSYDPKTVSTGVGAVVIEGFAPTVTATNNQTVSPGVGAIVIEGHAPTLTVTDNKTVEPGTGEVVIEGHAPTISVSNNVTLEPGVGEVQIVGYEPTVTSTANQFVNPGVGEIIIEGFAPTVTTSANQNLTPGVGEIIIEGHAPTTTVTGNNTIEPGLGSIIIQGYAPTITVTGETMEQGSASGPNTHAGIKKRIREQNKLILELVKAYYK